MQVEFEGTIESLTPPTLRVAGRTVETHSNTHLHGQGQTHSLADFNVGDEVEIEGVQRPDGTVLADDIKRTKEVNH